MSGAEEEKHTYRGFSKSIQLHLHPTDSAVQVYCSTESQIGICICNIKTSKGLVEERREENRAMFLLFGSKNRSVPKVPGV